ncbi:MAG: glycoside hydrolase family 95-like protein, partial [Opitutales bacterium]
IGRLLNAGVGVPVVVAVGRVLAGEAQDDVPRLHLRQAAHLLQAPACERARQRPELRGVLSAGSGGAEQLRVARAVRDVGHQQQQVRGDSVQQRGGAGGAQAVRGLRARGGFEVDLTWADGALVSAVLRAPRGGQAVLRYGDVTRDLTLEPGREFTWDGR